MNCDSKIKKGQSGAAAVEFAIVIGILLMIVSGIIEFGRVFWYYDALTKATRDGARFMSSVSVDQVESLSVASTPDCNSSYSPITANRVVYCAAVAAKVPGFTIGNIVVSCDGGACVDNTAPQHIKVAITGYNVELGSWLPFAAVGTLSLQPHTTMRYMR